MNQTLLTDIYNQLKSAVSATTSNVHFLYLPSEELLSEVTVVYELENTSNESTFDSKEASKVYSLRVQINAPTTSSFPSNSLFIKSKIYRLGNLNENVRHVELIDEQLIFDNELNVFTEFLRFEIQYN